MELQPPEKFSSLALGPNMMVCHLRLWAALTATFGSPHNVIEKIEFRLVSTRSDYKTEFDWTVELLWPISSCARTCSLFP